MRSGFPTLVPPNFIIFIISLDETIKLYGLISVGFDERQCVCVGSPVVFETQFGVARVTAARSSVTDTVEPCA